MAHPTNTQFAMAVHLLTLLADAPEGELLDSRGLAVSPGTNPAHVRRVLGHLREAGLVLSHAGSRGGWALAAPAEEIDLARVWLAVHGDEPVLGLHTPDINCPVGQRIEERLREVDRRALAALLAELSSETVADVLSEGTRRASEAVPAQLEPASSPPPAW